MNVRSTCLNDELIARILDGEVDPSERAGALRHADGCSSFRRLLAAGTALRSSVARGVSSPLEPEREALPGTSIGRYLVLSRLGSGAMGVVYLAYDPELDRRVAVKVTPAMQARLRSEVVGEAQAMARLSHPNVVAVHDTGSVAGQVFIAMEHIEGKTLRSWLASPRSWREVVRVLCAAGRGLAAAHAAGLVHRDFKPANVLVGTKGEVKVADFGLASPLARADGSGPACGAAVAGTLAFMAPEQQAGSSANELADQYSFCATLREALAGRPAPAWLSRLIARGTRASPDERYPSMEALLRELDSRPSRGFRWTRATVSLLAVLSGTAGAVQLARSRRNLCSGAERQLAGVWDLERRTAVGTAFRATQAPSAENALAAVERTLDSYVVAWTHMHREACEATRVRGEQSEALLDLRMTCLQRRLRELAGLTEALSKVNRVGVENATLATLGLTDLNPCADHAALTSEVPLPSSHVERAEVEALRVRIDAANTLHQLGSHKEALAAALDLASSTGQSGYLPVKAEVLGLLGSMQSPGNPRAGKETLFAAVLAAEEGRSDRIKARALLQLARTTSRLGEHAEAERLLELARASGHRLAHDRELEARLWSTTGHLRQDTGRLREAAAAFRREVALREQFQGANHAEVALALTALGTTLPGIDNVGRVAAYRRAVSIYETSLGPTHPLLAQTLLSLATAEKEEGALEQALEGYNRVLSIFEQTYPAPNIHAATTRFNRVDLLVILGRRTEAVHDAAQVLETFTAVLGPNHPHVALAHDLQANLHLLNGLWSEAEAELTAASSIEDHVLEKNHPSRAATLVGLGLVRQGQRRFSEARALHQRALNLSEMAGLSGCELGGPLLGVAESSLEGGAPADALAAADRLLSVCGEGRYQATLRAQAQFARARAQLAAGTTAAGTAILEARAARDRYVRLPDAAAWVGARMDAWLGGRR